jgi:hypothetical protein
VNDVCFDLRRNARHGMASFCDFALTVSRPIEGKACEDDRCTGRLGCSLLVGGRSGAEHGKGRFHPVPVQTLSEIQGILPDPTDGICRHQHTKACFPA